MSASREKKKRQEFLASGGVDTKAVREAEKMAATKKANRLYTILGIAFVVIAIALVVYNSNIIQRSQTALTVGDKEYTAADVSYYYGNIYQNFLASSDGQTLVALGMLNTSLPLDSQMAFGTEDGDSTTTWADYFQEEAVNAIRQVEATLAKAEEEGVTLTDVDMEVYDSTVERMKTQAKENGYTYGSFLKAVYGSTMTTKVYEENLKNDILANKYSAAYFDSLSVTEDEILASYEENKNNFDFVNGGYVYVSGTPVDADGKTISEPTEEQKTQAMADAKVKAEEIKEAVELGANLVVVAESYGVGHTTGEELTYDGSVPMEWLFEDGREHGDVEVLEDADNSRYCVAVFNSRSRNTAPSTYDVRHILITQDSLDLAEGTVATVEMVKAKAEEILASWDGTEEHFAALAEEFSTDTGSNTNGGLYEKVYQGTMVDEFESWCLDESRKAGDTDIVESDHGQHIMYFVGASDVEYWYYASETTLLNEQYTAWQTELVEGLTAEVQSGMKYVG